MCRLLALAVFGAVAAAALRVAEDSDVHMKAHVRSQPSAEGRLHRALFLRGAEEGSNAGLTRDTIRHSLQPFSLSSLSLFLSLSFSLHVHAARPT